MIVPYVAGGGSDQRARLVAGYLGLLLNRPVDVVNRTGAVAGHAAIAQAAPDGNTIGLITGEIGMMHWHHNVTPLTPGDYTALAVPYVESAAIIVRNDAPFCDLAGFLDACRGGPVRGSGGPDFSIWKFALLGLLRAAGIATGQVEWTETYSGEEGLARVLAGEALVAPITMTDARAALRSGQARALATMDDRRHPGFPEVPTVQEAIGIPWAVAHWRGLVAPRGLPLSIRDAYIAALRQVAEDARFQAEASAKLFTLRWRFGDQFARYMEHDDTQFGALIDALGAKAGSAAGLY
jgi:tripartite-type tricarboxylate transporter receptor subunit TctC